MSRFRFTREERLLKGREAATGWGSTRKMTALEFAAMRERRAFEKRKIEQEMLRKREEEARKSMAASKQLEAKRIGGIAGMPRKRSKFKILLFLIIIAALVYLYLKYVMRIID